jgi:hypothetical protein
LDEAQNSEAGQLLRRALDMRALLKLGLPILLEEIAADEMFAMLIVEEEQNRFDNERAKDAT